MIRRSALFLVVVVASAAARADHSPSRWALDEPVAQGHGVAPGTAVTITDVVVTDTTGSLTLIACCGLEDLATCPTRNEYLIEWALDRDVRELRRGDSVGRIA